MIAYSVLLRCPLPDDRQEHILHCLLVVSNHDLQLLCSCFGPHSSHIPILTIVIGLLMIISTAAVVLNVYRFRLDFALPRIAPGALIAAYPDPGVHPVLDFLEDPVLVHLASIPGTRSGEHDLLSPDVGGL